MELMSRGLRDVVEMGSSYGHLSGYTACHGVCATTLDDSELALDAGITCDPDLARRAY